MNYSSRAVFAALLIAAPFVGVLNTAHADAPPIALASLHWGAPGDSSWMITELQVNASGVTPSTFFHVTQSRCPFILGSFFMTGDSPHNATVYNGLAYLDGRGREGAHWNGNFVAVNKEVDLLQDDSATCQLTDVTMQFGELPLGRVWVITFIAGAPSAGEATLGVDGPGVSVVAESRGATSFWLNNTQFAGGESVMVASPPVCGSPVLTVPPGCAGDLPAGTATVDVEAQRIWGVKFHHHPFFFFQPDFGLTTIHNETVTAPDGRVLYSTPMPGMPDAVTPVFSEGVITSQFDLPPGTYVGRIAASAGAGPGAEWMWSGADVWFPEEQG